MSTSNQLDILLLPQVKRIAGALGLDTSGRNKASLVRSVSRKLSTASGGDPVEAVQRLVGLLTPEEMQRLLFEQYWIGASSVYEFDEGAHLGLMVARNLLETLCSADALDDDGTTMDRIARASQWAQYMRVAADEDEAFDDDEDENSGDDVEESDDAEDFLLAAAAESSEGEWAEQSLIAAGPGLVPSTDLEPKRDALFEHQQRALRALTSWWNSAQPAGILSLPTGAGKTRTATAFALRQVVGQSGGVLWLAHRHELVNQAVMSFATHGEDAARPFFIGRFEAGRRKTPDPVDVLVASVTSLAYDNNRQVGAVRRLCPNLKLIVVDECHHAVARTWRGLIATLQKRHPGVRVLGLSATPTRTSERERPVLARIFGRLIHSEPTLPLIQAGILASPRVTIVRTERRYAATEAERRFFVQFHDLSPALIRRMGQDHERNRFISGQVAQNARAWGRILLFAATVEQAEQLQRLIHEHLSCAVLTGASPKEERRAAVAAFRDGRLRVLVNVELFTEGTDLPAVDTVVLARPTKSPILFQQMVGRGMRGPKVGGTASCNIIAYTDDILGLMGQQIAGPDELPSFITAEEALEELGSRPSRDSAEQRSIASGDPTEISTSGSLPFPELPQVVQQARPGSAPADDRGRTAASPRDSARVVDRQHSSGPEPTRGSPQPIEQRRRETPADASKADSVKKVLAGVVIAGGSISVATESFVPLLVALGFAAGIWWAQSRVR